jgi:hypothetical protein
MVFDEVEEENWEYAGMLTDVFRRGLSDSDAM